MRLHLVGVDAMVSVMAAFRSRQDELEPLRLRLTLSDFALEPRRLVIPSGRAAVLVVHNVGTSPAEIVSTTLGMALVVAAGRAVSVRVRPLRQGEHVVVDCADVPGARVVLVAEAG